MAAIGAERVVGYEGPNEPDLNTVTFGGMTDARRKGST
jgi:hypothetical protein